MKTNKKLQYLSLFAILFLVSGLYGQTWQQHFDEGKRLYNSGDYESAFQAFQNAQSAAPNPGQVDPFLAQAAYRAGKFQEAAEAYQRSRGNSGDTWNPYNQGNAQFRNNDLNGAIESYKDALRKDPNNEMARYNLAYAQKKQQEQQNQENKDNNQDNQNQQDQNNQQNNNQQNQNNQNQQQGENQPKLGREQTEQLLESMNQADKKALDKLKDKEKALGSGKREKDW
jgi:Ca-activated chloride channel homolog